METERESAISPWDAAGIEGGVEDRLRDAVALAFNGDGIEAYDRDMANVRTVADLHAVLSEMRQDMTEAALEDAGSSLQELDRAIQATGRR